MGECSYFIKAQFSTCRAAKLAAQKMSVFIEEMYDLNHGVRHPGSIQDWRKHLRLKHPTAYGALMLAGLGAAKNWNFISGGLDYGDPGQLEFNLQVAGRFIHYTSPDVSHLAGWGILDKWLRVYCDAAAVGWCSQEDLDPFDGIGMIKSVNKER